MGEAPGAGGRSGVDFAARAERIAARTGDLFGGTSITYGWGDPNEEAKARGSSWLRVPARSTLSFVILSDRPVKYFGHWHARDFVMCPDPGKCDVCTRGLGGDYRYALSVYLPEQSMRAFLELPAKACVPIFEIHQKIGVMRGLAFLAFKEGQRVNGKITLKSQNIFPDLAALPEAEDPAPHLLRQHAAKRMNIGK